jgi:ferric-dicitrate binding protein FerR (iron transport regulator)
MEKKMDINTLIRKAVTGEINKEELEELQQRINEDHELAEQYAAFMNRRDLVDRYRQWAQIDKDSHKRAMLKSRQTRPLSFVFGRAAKAVASIAAVGLIIFGVATWFNSPHPVKPVLPTQVEQAIAKAQQQNRTEATLFVSGARPVKVSDGSKTQDIAEQLADERDKETASAESFGTVVTSHDKEFWMTLEDGTRVHLNYGSSFTYPLKFGDTERRVSVQGEAYFFVAKDSKRKFIVETAQGIITDYGTEFDVNTSVKGCTQVVLVSGKVGVSHKGGRETLLSPGTKAVIEPGHAVQLTKVDTTPYEAWNTGQYYFDGSTLEQLMNVVGKWYNVEVSFENDETRKVLFTGSLDRYESVEPTLHAISVITGRDITIEGKRVIIK